MLLTMLSQLVISSTPQGEQAILLVLGPGRVFPQSSIHPEHLCSLPERLDPRVKSDPS